MYAKCAIVEKLLHFLSGLPAASIYPFPSVHIDGDVLGTIQARKFENLGWHAQPQLMVALMVASIPINSRYSQIEQ